MLSLRMNNEAPDLVRAAEHCRTAGLQRGSSFYILLLAQLEAECEHTAVNAFFSLPRGSNSCNTHNLSHPWLCDPSCKLLRKRTIHHRRFFALRATFALIAVILRRAGLEGT